MAGVTTTHEKYDEFLPYWQKCADAVAGDRALDKKPSVYLWRDYINTDPDRYEAYWNNRNYTNYTGRTEDVLVGMVFRKQAKYELPKSMEQFIEDFDGSGESIDQVAKKALRERLEKSRYLFLADFPRAPKGLSQAEEDDLKLRPFASRYEAESLINWRFSAINGIKKLVLAVLCEKINIAENEFETKDKLVYRVLRLEDGVYTQEVIDESGKVVEEKFTPMQARIRGGRGAIPFDYIPLHGVRDLYDAALYPIASQNLKLYKQDTNIMNFTDLLGSPNLHIDIGETTLEEWRASNPGTFKVGEQIGTLTKGGKIEFVQVREECMSTAERNKTEEKIAALGGAIAQKGGQAETAEAARIRAGNETSQLDDEVTNLSEDIEATLESFARFIGEDPDAVIFELNTEFFDPGVDPQMAQAIMQGRILYGDKAALHMYRVGSMELPPGMTDEQLMEDAAQVMPDIPEL